MKWLWVGKSGSKYTPQMQCGIRMELLAIFKFVVTHAPSCVHSGPYTHSCSASGVTWSSYVWQLEGWTRRQPCPAQRPACAEAGVGTSGVAHEHQPGHGGGSEPMLRPFAGAVPMQDMGVSWRSVMMKQGEVLLFENLTSEVQHSRPRPQKYLLGTFVLM